MTQINTEPRRDLKLSELQDIVTQTVTDMGLPAKAQELDEKFDQLRTTWDGMTSAQQTNTVKSHMRSAQAEARSGRRAGARMPHANLGLVCTLMGMARASERQGRDIKPVQAVDDLKALGGEFARAGAHIEKSLQASTMVDGGALLPEEYSNDFIEFLHAESVVRQMGARVVPMSTGTLVIGRQDATATAYWIGEGAAITTSQQQYGQVRLDLKKLGILVPISNDLVRLDTIPRGIVELVRDDIVRVALNAEEKALLAGTGVQGQPLGIYERMGSGQRFAANGSFTVASATSDLLELMYRVIGQDIPMIRPGFVGNPRTKFALMSLRTDDGYPVFMDMLGRGEIFGEPVRFTNNVLRNRDDTGSAANDETRLYFADWAQIIIGEGTSVEITEATQASYVDSSSNTRHSFQRDESLVRLLHCCDITQRYAAAAACLNGIDWGRNFNS